MVSDLGMTATAVIPAVEYRAAFLAMLDDFDAKDPLNAIVYAPARNDFDAYVESLRDEEAGVNLPTGYVPCRHRWLVSAAGELVGVTRFRHNVDTPFLANEGGHIGYDVAPSQRRRGFGHFALAVSLREARRLGLSRVLLFASVDNVPSRATILRAGGTLECIAYSKFWNEQLCKYWVTVPIEN